MAQLSNPQWTPTTNNPVPCTTSVAFTVRPGTGMAQVRVRYVLRGTHLRFDHSVPPPAGVSIVRQTPAVLEEDQPVSGPTPVTRSLMLESTGQGRPALVTLDVFVADLVGGNPFNEHSSAATITFAP